MLQELVVPLGRAMFAHEAPRRRTVVRRVAHDRLVRYFLRITRRLRRGLGLRPRSGSGSVGAMTFALSLF